MRREIEVYNSYFGDCIVLKDRDDNSNLLVDFGIHYLADVSSAVYGNRKMLTESIADDIADRYLNSEMSLLITHFHEDHISGLIYMYQSGKINYKNIFKEAHIANIWDNSFIVASNLLEEMILENELRKSGLPRTTASLFDLLDFLDANVYRTKILKRGDLFENKKYITLWPDIDDRKNPIPEIIQSLGLTESFGNKLMELSENVCYYVTSVLTKTERHSENFNKDITIEDMRISYDSLLTYFFEESVDHEENSENNIKEKLNSLNHKYNIVFQNNVCGNENVLFTGDIEVAQMDEIAKAKDIPLHKQYKYIKIPHHGTARHYFDYSKYNPENVIITNGKVNLKNANSYKICKEYGNLNAMHLCTNSNHCDNCTASCRTSTSVCVSGRKLVYNKLYGTI